MKQLDLNTKVNAVVYYEKGTDIMIMSSDMNMSFFDYNLKSKGITSSMLGFDWTKKKSFVSDGFRFDLYHYEDKKFHAQFVELTPI